MNIAYEIKDAPDCGGGKGIFTRTKISAGTRIWSYKLNENVFEYNEDQCRDHLTSLTNLYDQQRFLDCTFGKNEMLCLIIDDGQYMNHADAPNCNCKTDLITGHCFAIKDILPGEQLFEDYTTFSHPKFLYEFLKKYNCEPDYYALPN